MHFVFPSFLLFLPRPLILSRQSTGFFLFLCELRNTQEGRLWLHLIYEWKDGLIQKTRRSTVVWLSLHLAPLQSDHGATLPPPKRQDSDQRATTTGAGKVLKEIDERVIKGSVIVFATLQIFIVLFVLFFYF